MSDGELNDVFTTIASVLHLGNISFEDDPDDNRGGCRVQETSEPSLQMTAKLMGLDPDELRRALTARVMQVDASSMLSLCANLSHGIQRNFNHRSVHISNIRELKAKYPHDIPTR